MGVAGVTVASTSEAAAFLALWLFHIPVVQSLTESDKKNVFSVGQCYTDESLRNTGNQVESCEHHSTFQSLNKEQESPVEKGQSQGQPTQGYPLTALSLNCPHLSEHE